MRYKVQGEWGGVEKHGDFYVQVADALDTKTGVVYPGGAARLVDAAKGMKPSHRGKGGTVPFFGETARQSAQSLARVHDNWRRHRKVVG